MSEPKIESIKDKHTLWVNLKESEASIHISSMIGKKFDEFIEWDIKRLAVDLSSVEFIDSSFLGTIVAAMKSAGDKDIDFVLYGLKSNVRTIFELTRLDKIVNIVTDRKAVENFFKNWDNMGCLTVSSLSQTGKWSAPPSH